MKYENYNIKRLCRELYIFLNNDNCENTLNAYKKYNIKFLKNNNKIIILFNNNIYSVGITIQDKEYYWILKPYNTSFFLTKSKLKGNLDIILLAIKENEEMYNNKKVH